MTRDINISISLFFLLLITDFIIGLLTRIIGYSESDQARFIFHVMFFSSSMFMIICVFVSKFGFDGWGQRSKIKKPELVIFALMIFMPVILTFGSIYNFVIMIPHLDFDRIGVYWVAYFILASALLVPIYEEIIFRGYLYNASKRLGPLAAFSITNLLFIALHLNHPNILFVFIMSCALFILRHRTDSVLPCIFVHMIVNAALSLHTVQTVLHNGTAVGG